MNSEAAARSKLSSLRDALRSLGDQIEDGAVNWAIDCLSAFLDEGQGLEQAFGVSGPRGRRRLEPGEGKHSDWTPHAWLDVQVLHSTEPTLGEVQVFAIVGRRYGLGGTENYSTPDAAVAAELRKQFTRYRDNIAATWAQEISSKLAAKDASR